MSRVKKQRTVKNFLDRKYGKNKFKTGPKSEQKNSAKKKKESKQKSVYQKYLEANPAAAVAEQPKPKKPVEKKPVQAQKPVAEEPVVQKLSPTELKIQALENDQSLLAIIKKMDQGTAITPDETEYFEEKMAEHEELTIQLEQESAEDLDIFEQFEKSRLK